MFVHVSIVAAFDMNISEVVAMQVCDMAVCYLAAEF